MIYISIKYLFFIIFLFTFPFLNIQGQSEEYFIKFNNSLSRSEINEFALKYIDLESAVFECPFTIDDLKLQHTYVVKNLPLSSITKLANFKKFEIEYIEKIPNYKLFLTPNDLGSNQWGLNRINAEQAWDISTGNNILIGLIDDAIELNHTDLQANIWTNPGEILGNGIDDDFNGYIDDVNGWDAADNDNDPNPPSSASNSFFSHGTHCAGISGAVTNNNIGISSIGFNSKIVPIKIGLDATGSLSGAYQGVDYAIASGVKIISMSWGGAGYSITYQNLFDYAHSIGIISIAAAGNNNSSNPMYPASYNHVISVGASNPNDLKANFSNFGPTIDVMAPGTNIYSTTPNSSYSFKSGTSMACPLVSGLTALMLGRNPLLSPDELEACLKTTCDDISSQNPNYIGQLGAGRINAFAALQCTRSISCNFTSNHTSICPNSTVQYTDLSNNSPTSWEWFFSGGIPSTSSLQNPLVTYSNSGVFDVKLIVHNINGTDTLIKTNYINVDLPSANISGSTTLVPGASSFLNISFTGNPPYSFVYSDGTSNYSFTGISSSNYQTIISPTSNTTYSLVSMSDSSCVGVTSGNAVITLVSLSNCVTSNTNVFQKIMGGATSDELKSIKSTSDGGLIMLTSSNVSSGNNNYTVIKLDASFNISWQKNIGTNENQGYYRSVIRETFSGGFIISGTTINGSNRKPHLIKLNNLGNILWERTVGGPSGAAETYAYSFQDVNGDFICTGTTNQVISSSDVYITKFDDNGVLLNNFTYGRGGNDHGESGISLANGSTLICGDHEIGGANRASALTLLDVNYNILWSKSYNYYNGYNGYNHIIQKSNGNLIVVTTNRISFNDDFAVTEVDLLGNVIWSKNYGNSSSESTRGVVELPNGTVVIGGVSVVGGQELPFLINIDGNGNLIWSKSYGVSSAPSQRYDFNMLDLTIDGGLVYGANTELNNNREVLLIKTDACGNSGCNENDIIINVTSLNTVATNVNYSKVSHGTLINETMSIQNANFTESMICSDTIIPITPSITCSLSADFSYFFNCSLDSITFVDSSLISNDSIIFWQWNFGDGLSGGGSAIVNHLYGDLGSYDVELIVGTSASCFDTVTQTINLNYDPVLYIADSSICLKDSLIISPEISCSVGSLSYFWSPSSGVSDITVLQPTLSPDSTTVYTLTITDSLNNSYSATTTITVDSSCCKSYPSFMNSSPVCFGDSIFLNNTSSVNGNTTYFWNFGPNSTPTSYLGNQPPKIKYNLSGSFPISLIIVDDCGLDSIQNNVFINELPQVSIGEDTLVCDPLLVQLGDTSLGNLLYSWAPMLDVSDPIISNPTPLVSQTQYYYLTVQDPYTECSNKDSILVSLLSPIVSIEDITICLDSSTILNPIVDCGQGPFTYSWTPTTNLSNPNILSPTASPVNTTLYNLNITDGNNNSFSTSTTVIVDSSCCVPPTANIAIANQVCLNDFVEITNLSSNNGDPSYEWSFGLGAVPNTFNGYQPPNIQYSTAGPKHGNLIISNDCGAAIIECNVLINSLPNINFFNKDAECEADSVLLEVIPTLNVEYSWTPISFFDTPNQQSSLAIVNPGSYYTVSVRDTLTECESKNSFLINILPCKCEFDIPNIFTPNNDGSNDLFFVASNGTCSIKNLKVYNRWGSLVYQNLDLDPVWSGHNIKGHTVAEGTYYYIVDISNKEYYGTVNLMR